MRILRVVQDYWPSTGGNERWALQHDRWFSETAGDDVQVLVLRPEFYFSTQRFRDLVQGMSFPGAFEVPGLPRVRAHQEIVRQGPTLRTVREYRKLIRPWLTENVDVVITQLFQHHTLASWAGWPVAFEAPWLLACTHSYHRPDCSRGVLMCRTCFREGGTAWWVRDQMKQALYRRFDLILGDELIARDLEKLDLSERVHQLRHLVSTEAMRRPLQTTAQRHQKAMIDELASRCPFVLMQLSRLHSFKGPMRFLDVIERLPRAYGGVFAGDGPERQALEARVEASDSLRGRVVFLGAIDVEGLAAMSEQVSAFMLMSAVSNHNTALFETMGVGTAPVVAIDRNDFPPGFSSEEVILAVSTDPDAIAADLQVLLRHPERCRAMTARARAYVERHHSFDQMWAYRSRLQQLADTYRQHRQSSSWRLRRLVSSS